MKRRLVGGAALLAITGGCATLVCGPSQKVTVESSPPGATVRVGDQTVVTPATVVLPRGSWCTLRAAKEGYYDTATELRPVENPYVWGNFAWDLPTTAFIEFLAQGRAGPVIVGPGSGIDRWTGAGYRLIPAERRADAVQTGAWDLLARSAGFVPPVVRLDLEPKESEVVRHLPAARAAATPEPHPHVEATIPVGGPVAAVTAGAGAVWAVHGHPVWGSFLQTAGSDISRIDPQTNRVTATFALPAGHLALPILVNADGLWVRLVHRPLFGGARSISYTLARMDPHTGAVTSTTPLGRTAPALAEGAGALWAVCRQGWTEPKELLRIDPKTGQVTARIPLGGESHPGQAHDRGPHPHVTQLRPSVAVGLGAVWVADAVAQTLARFDLQTGRLTEVPLPQSATELLAGEEALWAFDTSARSAWPTPEGVSPAQVTRIDPRTGEPSPHPSRVGGLPCGRAVGLAGVWVLCGEDGTLLWIDPATGHVVPDVLALGPGARRPFGHGGLALAEGSLWAVGDKSVLRIAPR
jgi:streptogramin lyase